VSAPDEGEPERIAVGRITRAHGIKGEVAVLPLTQVESRFDPGSRLEAEGLDEPLTVASARPHRHGLLVEFEGVHDRTEAERLQGRYLVVPASAVPPLPEGEFWPHQLIGCEVVTDGGRSLGAITEVIHTPANDVWATDGPDGQSLIPALKDVVTDVDLEARRVTVREIPGLTAP
jgi:16S rRNA processing protein RimM